MHIYIHIYAYIHIYNIIDRQAQKLTGMVLVVGVGVVVVILAQGTPVRVILKHQLDVVLRDTQTLLNIM